MFEQFQVILFCSKLFKHGVDYFCVCVCVAAGTEMKFYFKKNQKVGNHPDVC
jgi:hypothetical protein